MLDKTGHSVVVESPDGVQYKRNSTCVKKFLEQSNMPESQILASPPTSDISTEYQPQPSVNGSEEHSGETRTQTAAGNTAEPDSEREHCTKTSDLKTLLCLENR